MPRECAKTLLEHRVSTNRGQQSLTVAWRGNAMLLTVLAMVPIGNRGIYAARDAVCGCAPWIACMCGVLFNHSFDFVLVVPARHNTLLLLSLNRNLAAIYDVDAPLQLLGAGHAAAAEVVDDL